MGRLLIVRLIGACILFLMGFLAGQINPTVLQSIVQHQSAPDGPVGGALVATSATQEHQSNGNINYSMAYTESLHFFDDIDNDSWRRMKTKVREIQPNTNGNDNVYKHTTESHRWFQNHFEPDFTCQHERRIGKLGDGGKWVCDPHRLKDKEQCLVYSIGSNDDASFEAAVKKDIGEHCEIHTFDMGNYSSTVEATGAHYHQWGLNFETYNGKTTSFKSLADTVKLLGHEGRTIDIFKIDCEGCEWKTVSSWFEANVTLRQVQIEVHEGYNRAQNRHFIPQPDAPDFFKKMYKEGYVIFHKEPNIMFWKYAKCVEYAFLRLDQSFFLDEEGESWLK